MMRPLLRRLRTAGRTSAAAAVLAAAAAAGSDAAAAPLAIPAAPDVPLVRKVGERLPADLALVDDAGRPVQVADWLGGRRALVVVPGYYRCTVLCGLVMQGVLESLAGSGLRPSAWCIVGFSIDPGDTPADARARERTYRDYAAFLAQRDHRPGDDGILPPSQLTLFTGDRAAIDRLAAALGYRFERGDPGAPIAHSAAFMVLTPDGRIARYFPGVRFDAAALRQAIDDARAGRIAGKADGWSDRLALLCSHFNPASGRHSGAVMTTLRVLGVLGALALAAWIWRRRCTARETAP